MLLINLNKVFDMASHVHRFSQFNTQPVSQATNHQGDNTQGNDLLQETSEKIQNLQPAQQIENLGAQSKLYLGSGFGIEYIYDTNVPEGSRNE